MIKFMTWMPSRRGDALENANGYLIVNQPAKRRIREQDLEHYLATLSDNKTYRMESL